MDPSLYLLPEAIKPQLASSYDCAPGVTVLPSSSLLVLSGFGFPLSWLLEVKDKGEGLFSFLEATAYFASRS